MWILPVVMLSTGAAGVALRSEPSPQPPVAQHQAGDESVVPTGLWVSLEAPDTATLTWLARRIPGIDRSAVRTLTAPALEAMFTDAIARGLSPLDFFTDSGFLGHETYYVPQATLVSIFALYEIRVLTAVSGTDVNGRSFNMVALILGGGRIEALYDRDAITFVHPEFDNKRYTLAARVSQGILGPGDMSTSGIMAHVAFFNPAIQRMTKISPTEARIQTSMGSRNKPVTLIRRRVFVAQSED